MHEYCQWSQWPDSVNIRKKLHPCYDKREDLSLENGIFFMGTTDDIARKYRAQMMKELYSGHPGMVRIKVLSRIHVRFPNIDQQM